MMDEALTRLHAGLPTNPLVTISTRKGKGWIGVTPLSAQPEPRHLGRFKGVLGERWPTTSLLDMLEGEGRVSFSFAGRDEMDEVHGRGELRIEGALARFMLAWYQGDTFTSICERLGD